MRPMSALSAFLLCLLPLALLPTTSRQADAEPTQSAKPKATQTPLEKLHHEATVEGVRKVLKFFNPNKEEQAKIAGLIEQWESEKFAAREKATQELLKYPVLPVAQLNKAAKSRQAEIARRARHILAQNAVQQNQRLLKAVFDTIAQKKLPGMTNDVVQAVSYVRGTAPRQSIVRALLATATKEDRASLVAALKHPQSALRLAATRAIIKTQGKEIIAPLKTVLDDSDPQIVLIAARALGNQKNRASLDAFIRLLHTQYLPIQLEAVQSLQSLTGQSFGYEVTGDIDQHEEAIAKWQAWVKKNGKTATLHTPIKVSGKFSLLNGKNLNNWSLFLRDRKIEPKNVCTVWQVKKKNEISMLGGMHTGYMRTNQAFRNYHLSLDYRWMFKTRLGRASVIIIQTGPDAGLPSSLTIEITQTEAGILGTGFRFPVPAHERKFLGKEGLIDKNPKLEKAPGQWNHLDIDVRDGVVTVKLNGVLRSKVSGVPSVPGRIGLRLQRFPYDVRNIEMTLPLSDDM